MPLFGNATDNRAVMRSGVEHLDPGFTGFALYGVAAITTTGAASWAILDTDGNPFTVPASAADPSYLAYCSFNLPAGLVADAASRVLKLAPLATTAAGGTSASSAVSGATPFAYAAEAIRSASVPGTLAAITAATTLALFSTDGANAAAGTLAAAAGVVYVDCEVVFVRRKLPIKAGDAMRTRAQAYIAAGVVAGAI